MHFWTQVQGSLSSHEGNSGTEGRSSTDQVKDLDVNTAVRGIFMSVTLQSAVHLARDYTENLRSTKNQPKKSLSQLFQVTERLITDQTEITGLTTIDWQKPMCRETTLLTDRAVQFATAKTYVFSDSVLCLEVSVLNKSKHGKVRLNGFWKHVIFQEWDRIDGGPVEFEWKKFSGFTTLGTLDEIQKLMTESKCELEQFKGRIIFMSMYNDIGWTKRRNKENCFANALRVIEYARSFTQGHWSFLEPGSQKKWYGTYSDKPDGDWDKTAEGMMLNFAESGHPVFRASSALERGELKSKGKGVKSIHFNGSDETIELILRTVISVNQLSVYGAVADLCKELARDSSGAGKPAANENLESIVIPTEFPAANPFSQTDAEVQRKMFREYEQKFAELLVQQKLTELCSNAGFSNNIDKGQFFKYALPRNEETSRVRGWIRGDMKIGLVLDVKVCYLQGRYGVEIMIGSLFRDRTVSCVRIVNGINKYVTETPEEILDVALTFQKFIIRLLRHDDTVHREDDGAVRFHDLIEEL